MKTGTNAPQRYPVGLRFTPLGRDKKEHTVVDFYVTKNLAGETVKERYVCEYVFCGQPVRDYDVAASTIARATA